MIGHTSKKRKLSHCDSSILQDSPDSTLTSLSESSEVNRNKSQPAILNTESQILSSNGSTAPRHARAQDLATVYASLSHSRSLLQMQVGQLIADVSVKHGNFSKVVNPFLKRIEQIINAIPSQNSISANEAHKFIHQTYGKAISIPQDGPKTDAKYAFSYGKPAIISTIGSHVLQTDLKNANPNIVDMAIVMPSSIFQAKDYKQFRYFHKRAYYLACIVVAIRKAGDLAVRINFDYENDCLMQPILLLTPLENAQFTATPFVYWQIRLLTAVDENVFPARKPLPWDDCFWPASAWSEARLRFTLGYNSALRTECSRMSYENLLGDTCKRCPGYRDACKLGNLWLQQRGFKAGFRATGFGAFEFNVVAALLLSGTNPSGRPVLSAGYDSFQLFKGVLYYLATRDFMKKPSAINGNVIIPSQCAGKAPMLYDATRGLNILYKMNLWSYQCLTNEAQTTLRAFSNSLAVGHVLEGAFISKIDWPILRYDMVARLKIPISWSSDSSELRFEDRATSFASKLYKVLLEGLDDRVTLINLQQSEFIAQQIDQGQSSSEADSIIIVQLLLNSEHSNRMIDRGPSAEDKQAATAYRRFWGERAELRRYKDGSILESLVWSQSSIKGSVCEQIIKHVVGRHFGEPTVQSLTFIANNFHQPLCDYEHQIHQSSSQYSSAFAAYVNLEKQIRNSGGLPLQLRRIAASCEHLRYTSLLTMEETFKGPNALLDIVVQFEGSSRWPNSLPAIQRTKIAFLSKIGAVLEESTPNLFTRVGLENTNKQPIQNLAFLDIITPNLPHQAFRLRIHHEQELAILERQLKGQAVSLHSRALIAAGTAIHKQKFLNSPLHTQVVASLCTRYPLLSPSIRLLKRWCATHLLSAVLLPPEVLELLTIRCFVSPFPWSQPPASIRTGFLRTLSLIAKWDWPREPMIIDANGEMKEDERDAIQLNFKAWRKIDPGMNRVTLFIASTMDTGGVTWTERAVEKVVAGRLQSLAKAACQLVHDGGIDIDVQALFVHNYNDYDFLIHLNATRISSLQKLGTKHELQFKNLQTWPDRQGTLSTGFEPLNLFVKELGSIYQDSLLLFHNPLKPNIVGGLWHPSTSMQRLWKVGLGYSTCPRFGVEDRVKNGRPDKIDVDFNKWAVLREIKDLGGDMVESLEMLEHRRLQ